MATAVYGCSFDFEYADGSMSAETVVTQAVCTAKNYSPVLGININLPAGHLAKIIENPDAVQIAAELGRLDFVSGILAALGIMLGLAAIWGFWTIRGAAQQAAVRAAKEEIKELLPIELKKLLTQACVDVLRDNPKLISAALLHNPSILLSAVKEANDVFFGDVDGEEADIIATTIDKGR